MTLEDVVDVLLAAPELSAQTKSALAELVRQEQEAREADDYFLTYELHGSAGQD